MALHKCMRPQLCVLYYAIDLNASEITSYTLGVLLPLFLVGCYNVTFRKLIVV